MKTLFLAIIAIALIFLLAIPVIAINTIRKWVMGDSLTHYFKMIGWGFYQVGGTIIYAQEDWMVSSWTYHLEQCGNKHAYYFRVFIDLIFGKNHCKESYFDEAARLKFKAEWEEINERA